MKVKFTKAYKVKADGGESYAEGDVVDLEDASAAHFINRGVAEEVVSGKKAAAASAPVVDDGSPDLGADRGKGGPDAAKTADVKGAAKGK